MNGGGNFGTAKKKNMIHGSVNISFKRLFGHLHSNLYLGEELCVTTTFSDLLWPTIRKKIPSIHNGSEFRNGCEIS